MSILFKIQEGVVFPTEQALVLPPIKKILERDKTDKKDKASREFAYVEFYCSKLKSNPYSGYIDDKERDKKIREGLFDGLNWKPDKAVKDVIKLFMQFQYEASPTLQFYESALDALRKIQNYYKTLDMTLTTRSGMLVNKPSEVIRGLSGTATLLTDFTALREKIEQELLTNTKTKGNRTINEFEK